MAAPVTTREGFVFDPGPDVWQIGSQTGPVLFNFSTLPGITDELRASIKEVLVAQIRRRAATGAMNALSSMRALLVDMEQLRIGPESRVLTLDQVDGFVRRLPSSRQHAANDLRRVLREWADLGIPGLSDELVDGLDGVRGENRVMGEAVRTCSPSRGALSKADVELLGHAILAAFAAGEMSLKDCCICLICLQLGARPSEIAALKTCDLSLNEDGSGLLKMPTSKLPGCPMRERRRDIPLVPQFAALLRRQRDDAEALGWRAGREPGQAPFLQRKRSLKRSASSAVLDGFEGHMSSKSVQLRVARAIDQLEALGHLGSGNAHVFACRLRRSFGTGMAEDGCSLEEIALVFGQGGPQVALAYVEATPAVVKELDRALGTQMDEFVRSFGLDASDPALRPRFGGSK